MKSVNTGVRFELRAGNGEVIAGSQVYGSRAATIRGVQSVRRIAGTERLEDQTVDGPVPVNPKYIVYLDKAGEYRFRLKAHNGQIVVVSEGYRSKQACLDGIESVRKNAATAKVDIEE